MKTDLTTEVIDMNSKKNNNSLPINIIKLIYSNNLEDLKTWINKNGKDNIDKDGKSLLIYAVIAGDLKIVDELLNLELNPNIKDKLGWTSLHYACQQYFPDIVETLLRHKVDIEAKDNFGNTPLWRATFSSKGRGEIIKILIAHGANINNKNNSNISPLELANTISNYNVKMFFEIQN